MKMVADSNVASMYAVGPRFWMVDAYVCASTIMCSSRNLFDDFSNPLTILENVCLCGKWQNVAYPQGSG